MYSCTKCMLFTTCILHDIGVSEWLLFNANSAIFQLYHGENMLISNEMMMVHAMSAFF